jgi:uncharacterized repeat protein (TIGR03803 family)
VIDTLQRSVSKMRLGAARVRLTLAFVIGLGMVGAPSAQAQTFTVLYNFTGVSGAYPRAGVIQDAAGNLYGTTYQGGHSNVGTVFKVDDSGTETVLHAFGGGTRDGNFPAAALVRDTAGNFYGTTYEGGPFTFGTVFKLRDGKETVLHIFTGPRGAYPNGALIRGAKGNLLGTTEWGGTGACGSGGCGTVFELDATGRETVLHNFAAGASDGANAYMASLLMDKEGNLYGVTYQGGAFNSGVVYKLTKGGKLTVLHSFAGGTADGCNPMGTPAMDDKGNLFGTASGCGSLGDGIVWRVSKNGTETVLHNFAGTSDGAFPKAGVIRDANGNVYGDAELGGSFYQGTVYKLSESGTLTTLHSFNGTTDGGSPTGGLMRDSKGNLYGTTVTGGSGTGCNGCGTVWKLTP